MYFIGSVYEKMGNQARAREYWNEAINLPEQIRGRTLDYSYYRALCMQKLGKSAEAAAVFDELIEAGKIGSRPNR
jgi:tetratricopeptide (TPR) repeat protein